MNESSSSSWSCRHSRNILQPTFGARAGAGASAQDTGSRRQAERAARRLFTFYPTAAVAAATATAAVDFVVAVPAA